MLKKSCINASCTHSFFSKFLASSLLILTVTSCACTDPRKSASSEKDKDNRNKEIAALGTLNRQTSTGQAFAEIKSFKGDEVKGKITFTRVPEGIKIIADVNGLSPGSHGFHVHEFGDCSGEGEKTGEHFNPTKSLHGAPENLERHVGDLGNIIADEEGHAVYERVDTIISLEGENSIIGRSIVIHADPDDYTTQPSGASGKKIACGIIKAGVEREMKK